MPSLMLGIGLHLQGYNFNPDNREEIWRRDPFEINRERFAFRGENRHRNRRPWRA